MLDAIVVPSRSTHQNCTFAGLKYRDAVLLLIARTQCGDSSATVQSRKKPIFWNEHRLTTDLRTKYVYSILFSIRSDLLLMSVDY